MRVRTLGIAPGLPTEGLHHASVLVDTGRHVVLLDTGEGVAGQIMRYGYDHDTLDAVAITHFHPDHCSGFFMLIQTLHIQTRSKPLIVFLPERVSEFAVILPLMYTFPERLPFAIDFRTMEEIVEWDPAFQPLPSDHLKQYRGIVSSGGYINPMCSWSILVHESERQLIYTSDYSGQQAILPFLDETDLLITNANQPPADAIIGMAGSGVKRIKLIHGLSEQLHNLLKENTLSKIEFADEENEIVL